MSNLDEEIEQATANQEEEEQRRQEMEEMAVQERMERVRAQQAQRQSQVAQKNRALNAAKQQVKNQAKGVAKKAIWEFLISTSPYWGTALLIIGGIFLLIILIFTVFLYGCNESKTVKVANFVTWVSTFGQVDVCKSFKIAGFAGGASGGGGAGADWNDIVVTSAYRAGAVTSTGRPSAHGRGEAIDVALRNPTVSVGSTDPRIAQIIAAARQAGFTPVEGDIINEYATPTESTTGGHIHLEFNVNSANGRTYCDDTPVRAGGPNDLVTLVGSVPVDTSSTSDPRVRPCMLNATILFFSFAQP